MSSTPDDTEVSTAVEIPLTHDVAVRLSGRQEEDEQWCDIIRRLLDETTEEVPIREILTDVFDHYDEVAAIVVYHDFIKNPSSLDIRVKTPDISGFHESSSLYASSRYRAVVDTGDERFRLPVYVTADRDGPPPSDSSEWTTVYRADTFLTAEPLALEDGIDRLRAKIGESREEVERLLKSDESGVGRY